MSQPRHPVGFAASPLSTSGLNQLRFQEAQVLLDQGALFIDETGHERLSGVRLLLTTQAARSLHSFECVVALTRIGRGVQAAMINRSLLEDALDVHWVAANPELALDRATSHDRLMALAEHQKEAEHRRTDRPLTEAEETELGELIELYGGARRAFRESWTCALHEEKLALAKERWADSEDAAGLLDYSYDVLQRRNNLLLHPSPTAYRRTMAQRDGNGWQLNRIGPDDRWRDALGDGAVGFYLTMRVFAEEFDFSRDAIGFALNQLGCYLKPAEDFENLGELTDGAECACGSGRTVETCHRS